MNKKTTISISFEVAERLRLLKKHYRETYEDVIRRLVEGENGGNNRQHLHSQY